jgi:Flp pilus assembly pilin Flp
MCVTLDTLTALAADEEGAAYAEVALIMLTLTVPMVAALFGISDACANRLTGFPGSVQTFIDNGP